MADIIQHSVVQALAWALVHFLWQGAAIGLASFIAFRLVRSASLRYAIGVGALVAMIAAPVTTVVVLSRDAAVGAAVSTPSDLRIAVGPITLVDSSTGVSATTAAGNLSIAPEALAIAVLAWLGGVAFFGIRLVGGWVVARRLTQRAVQPAADHIQAVARQIADRLALHRAVTVLQSSAIAVPVMVGWLKPVVILPVAALAGLSPSQMEALLAHELAHVRRQDYLVNLLQSVAEALLFYHPAVWWLSHRVRADRELCCDDLAVSVCDPLVYATALTDLAAMTSPGLALAATDGDLLGRVRRILGQPDVVPAMRAGAMPLLALVLVAGVAVPVAFASTQAPVVVRPVEVVVPEVAREVRPEPVQAVEVAPERQDRPITIPQTPQQQAEQRRVEEVKREEARRKVAEIERALEQVMERQAKTVGQAVEARQVSEAAQAAREIEIAAAKLKFESVKQKFEVGLVSQAQLNEARASLMKAQVAGDPAALNKLEQQAAMQELLRARQLVEKGLMSTNQLADLEANMKLWEQTRSAVAKSAEAKELSNLAKEQLLRELQARVERVREVAVEAQPAAEGQPVAANEPVKAGDYLRINIEGEDVRMEYRVGAEGMIKLPLIGPLKVIGLTAAQVRDAIGKQLVAHKLKTVDQVTVILTRPR